MTSSLSEDSDQLGHLPSLIRVFAVRMKKAWVLSYPLSAQRRLWSVWADAWNLVCGIGFSTTTLYTVLLVLSWGGSNVGHWDLYFMVHWFGVISVRLFDLWTSYLGIMGQYDRTFDLKINVCQSDLHVHFMVQWFCLISQRLFDGWVLYFQIMRYSNPNFDNKINIGHHDLHFIVLWFCLISSRLFDGWTSKLV